MTGLGTRRTLLEETKRKKWTQEVKLEGPLGPVCSDNREGAIPGEDVESWRVYITNIISLYPLVDVCISHQTGPNFWYENMSSWNKCHVMGCGVYRSWAWKHTASNQFHLWLTLQEDFSPHTSVHPSHRIGNLLCEMLRVLYLTFLKHETTSLASMHDDCDVLYIYFSKKQLYPAGKWLFKLSLG